MTKNLTLRLTRISAGFELPDTGRSVSIKTVGGTNVASAVETPPSSGQYLISFPSQNNWGYWYVDNVIKDMYGNNSPFWLGNYDTISGSNASIASISAVNLSATYLSIGSSISGGSSYIDNLNADTITVNDIDVTNLVSDDIVSDSLNSNSITSLSAHFNSLTTTQGNVVLCQNAGNVGIGANPNRKLTVFGETVEGQIRVGSTDSYYWDIGRENTSTGRFMFKNNDNGSITEPVSFMTDGKVGIGTATPLAKLHVGETATNSLPTNTQLYIPGIIQHDGAVANRLALGVDNNAAATMNLAIRTTPDNQYPLFVDICNNSTPLVTFKSDSNVGIGKQNPIVALDVNGSISSDSLTTTQGNVILCQNSGNVGIGTYPAYKLSVSGGSINVDHVTNPRFLISLSGGLKSRMMVISKDDNIITGSKQGDLVFYNEDSANNILFCTDTSSPVLTLTPTNRIGINTTTPAAALDVVGTISAQDDVFISDAQKLTSSMYGSGTLGEGFCIDNNGIIPGQSFAEVDNLRVRGTLRAHIFQKDIVRASNGFLLITDATTLVNPLSDTDVSITAKEAVFQPADILWIKDIQDSTSAGGIGGLNINSEFLCIQDDATQVPTASGYVYNVQRAFKSGVAQPFAGNSTVVRIGNSANTVGRTGVIMLDASSEASPFIDVVDSFNDTSATVPTTNPYTQLSTSASTIKVRLGKLNGIVSPTWGSLPNAYGLWAQDAWLEGNIVASAGYIGTPTQGWAIDSTSITSGKMKIVANSSTAYIGIGTSVDNFNDEGIFLGLYGSSLIPVLSLSSDTNNYVNWDGTKLTFKAINANLDSNGNLNLSGSVTAFTGKIANWNILTNKLQSNNMNIDSVTGINFNDKFVVDANGNLTGFNSVLRGSLSASTITAYSGYIGSPAQGWTIGSNTLSAGDATSHIELKSISGIWLGADNQTSAPFNVSQLGALTASNATIKTSSGTKRLELRSSDNELEFFENNDSVVRVGSNVYSTLNGIYINGVSYNTYIGNPYVIVSRNTITGAGSNYGVYSLVDGSSTTYGSDAVAVYGNASATNPIGSNIGIFGTANGSAYDWAGYFYEGDVKVTNDLIDDANIYVGNSITAQSITAGSIYTDNARLKTKVVNIGDWDMDANSTKQVAHGLGVLSAGIVSIVGIVRSDFDIDRYPIPANDQWNQSGTNSNGLFVSYFDSTYINLARKDASQFDDTGFDSTSYNRGFLTITYFI